MLIYLRKLYGNELGYRNGVPGGAGRFFFISKEFTNYFPPLSENIVNDSVYLQISPPFSDKVVLSRYIYHNDSIAGSGTRDEYRLYLNEEIDPGRDYYKPDDIILIRKIIKNDQETFKIYRYTPQDDAAKYQKLNEIIESNATRGSHHALLEEDLISFLGLPQEVSLDTEELIISENEKPKAFESPIFDENRRTYTVGNQTKKIRSQSFRDLVMLFYDYKCAITGEDMLIEYNSSSNLQAAHIVAVGHGGGDNPANGLPLIQDLHWAFEYGFFTITDDYKIKVHPDAMDSKWLQTLDGVQLKLPEDSRAKPNLEALAWHRDNFYGRFKKA